MGKHEVGSTKYIANKIKAKGLQKLRYYCQMCQKQCRDENGFKCHTMSESHHRQLLLFADNQRKYMDEFSREFSDGYLNLLRRQFGTRRTPANRVYQEYIADRGHIHMNATIWLSLTAYVKWLGKTGKCVVDETEQGWFVTYIDRDPLTLAAQEKKAKKAKMDKDDEERTREFIESQIQKGKAKCTETEETKAPLVRPEDDTPLVLSMKFKPKAGFVRPVNTTTASSSSSIIKTEPMSPVNKRSHDDDESPKSSSSNIKSKNEKKSSSDEESSAKQRGWLRPDIIVKVVTKKLGAKYYKAKGEIQSPVLESGYVAKIKLVSPGEVAGHVIKIDQEHLETVIPAIGKDVLVVGGKYAGSTAILRKVRIEEFCADVELVKSQRIVKRLPYESFCKYVGDD